MKDISNVKKNEVSAIEFLEYLENLYSNENTNGLLELRNASEKPIQTIILEDLEGLEYDNAVRRHKHQGRYVESEFLCNRSAPLIDLAHKNGKKVAHYEFGSRAANVQLIAISMNEYDKKISHWCKEVLEI